MKKVIKITGGNRVKRYYYFGEHYLKLWGSMNLYKLKSQSLNTQVKMYRRNKKVSLRIVYVMSKAQYIGESVLLITFNTHQYKSFMNGAVSFCNALGKYFLKKKMISAFKIYKHESKYLGQIDFMLAPFPFKDLPRWAASEYTLLWYSHKNAIWRVADAMVGKRGHVEGHMSFIRILRGKGSHRNTYTFGSFSWHTYADQVI